MVVTAGYFKLTQGVVVASFDGSSENMHGHNHVQHDGEDFPRVYGPAWLEKLEDITFCSTCGEDRPVGGSCPKAKNTFYKT